MKRIFISLTLCSVTLCGNAQIDISLDENSDFSNVDSFKASMDEASDEMIKEYYEFRKQCFEEYIEFSRNAWKWAGLEPPLPLPKDQEFTPEIVGDSEETNSWVSRQTTSLKNKIFGIFRSKKNKEDKSLAQDVKKQEKSKKKEKAQAEKVITRKEVLEQPNPAYPVNELKSSNNNYFTFTSFGTEYKVRIGEDCRFKLNEVTGNAILDALKERFSPQFENLLFDCLQQRKEHNLSDWAYYQMLCTLVDEFYGKNTNEADIALAYLFMQSGYKVRLAHDHQHVLLMIASRHSICGKSMVTLDDDKYYILRGEQPYRLCICDSPYAKELGLSLLIPDTQNLAVSPSAPRTITSSRYPDFSFTVSVNKNLIDFYDTYPSSTLDGDMMSKWAMYANAPLSDEVRNQLYPQMKAKLRGLSEYEAVCRLLNWVQTGFDYKYDNEVWGHDRPFFGEETLFYPYDDCEDRSILLSRLVRDLLGLRVALVYLPGHLATAIEFSDEVEGHYYFEIENCRFVFCDPTCIIGDIGECGRETRNVINKGRLTILEKDS